MSTDEARPWLDADLPAGERVAALLAAMTLEEKAGQLVQLANPDLERHADLLAAGAIGSAIVASGAYAGNVRDAGTQATHANALQRAALASRLGVPLLVARDVVHGHKTVFPIPLGQAAAFDPDLVRECARVAAREATADGVRWTFAPMVDVALDARWGRIAEGYGEDAWLTSLLGAAAVEGFQGGPGGAGLADEESLAACAKHYVGYGMAQGGRDYAEVDLGPVTLQNRHLRPFRAAVDAGVATVMSAFHTLDRVPMTASEPMLRGILKGDLGFDGAVVSDWDAVGEIVRHGLAMDLTGAATLALRAGVDVDMVTGAYATHAADLVRAGVVDEALLDDAVRRVLTLKVRLGLFERPYADESRAARVHLATEHRALARRAVASSVVLLRNDGVLPLRPVGKVHVTGPFATATEEMLGTWTLDGRGEDVVTIADALRERLAADGVEVTVDDGRFPDASHVAAREADLVIACVGEHPLRTGEANSVTSLELPPGQTEVLESLARVSRTLVVVVVTGRPLALERLAHLGSALVLAFHPGTEGGHGIVDVLTGAAPATGRLPASMPFTTGQVPLHHDHLPSGRPLDPAGPLGRYRDHSDAPQYPFGYGLGYSPVEYGPVRLSADRLGAGGTVRVSVVLRNIGEHPAVETAQLYVQAHLASISRPVSELVGVRRVPLAPGEEREVTFDLDHAALAHRDDRGRVRHEGGPFTVRIAPHAGVGAGAGPSARLDVDPLPDEVRTLT